MKTICGVVVSIGCAAPPLGIGTGAHHHAGSVATAVGVGVAPDREVVQVEAALAHRYSDRFALEYGGALTQVGVTRDDRSLVGLGALPYVRPRWQLGAASFAIAASGFAAAGGETGAVGAFADAQVGIGGARWSIYAGAYGLGYLEALGPSVAATQARLGAEIWFATAAGWFGTAVETFAGFDALRASEDPTATRSRFAGVGIKLRYTRR